MKSFKTMLISVVFHFTFMSNPSCQTTFFPESLLSAPVPQTPLTGIIMAYLLIKENLKNIEKSEEYIHH